MNGAIVAGADDWLDLDCVAAHGIFSCDEGRCGTLTPISKAATAFLLEDVAPLQEKVTVPMIDVRAYARWLDVDVRRDLRRIYAAQRNGLSSAAARNESEDDFG